MDVNTRATLPQTWGARVRSLDAVAPSPSPAGLSTADTKTPRSPAETAANSNSNSAEVSPAPSLSNSLSSSLGLSSSFVLASHLLAAPTPINTPNFGSAYIHRAARAGTNPSAAAAVAPAEGRDSLNENLGGTIDFRKWLARSRPPRRWVGGDEDDEDDDAVDEIEEENEDDEVEVGDDEDEEENLDEDVENKRDAKQKGQAIPQPRR